MIATFVVFAANEDASGRFWIGSQAGLFRLDIPTRTFYPTGIDAAIYGILEDDDLNLWISTNQGLIHFDPEQGMIKKRYHCGNGLVFDKFHQNAFFKSPRTGELFFGGVDGMVAFFRNRFGQIRSSRRSCSLIFRFLINR